MTAWYPVFVGVAVKSAAVWGVAWLVTWLMGRRSAAARHLIWTAAAAAIVALPILSLSLPALPVPADSAPMKAVPFVFRFTAMQPAPPVAEQAGQAPGAPQSTPLVRWSPDWRSGLIWIWIAGAAAAFAQMLKTCSGIWRLRRAARPYADAGLAMDLAGRLGLSRPVEVFETSESAMPMTFGILRPAIFLPSDASEWSQERRRIVMLHELAHVRRGDTVTQLLARLALVLHWWNPLGWKAWREFLKERERATDDMVLRAGECAVDYASHLLDVARDASTFGWAAVAMARRSQLEGRLAAILDSGASRCNASRASALAAALAAVVLVAPFAAVRAQDRNAQVVPPDVDATMRTAASQKNHEMLEKAAAAFEALRQYDTAAKLLESAVAIREEVSGTQSVDYGVGLIKLGDLERKRRRPKEAEAFYTKAALILGDRPEVSPALLYLGIVTLHKNRAQAVAYFERAERLDPSQAGKARMWIAMASQDQEKPAETEALFQAALAAQKPESVDSATTRELYARFLREQGRDTEAEVLSDAATATRKALETQTRQAPSGSIVFRVADGVLGPKVLFKVDPEYTDEARFAKLAGTVVIGVEIGPDGLARNIQVKKGIGLGLDESAAAAISEWRFKPGMRDGVPVTVFASIEVNFRLL